MKMYRTALALIAAVTLTPLLASGEEPLVIDQVLVDEPIQEPGLLPEPIPVPGQPPSEPGDSTDKSDETDEPPAPRPAAPVEPGVLRFHLMDGTIITGKLVTKALPVSTQFGELVVPIDAITTFSPGLQSHPDIYQQINTLIQQLASPDANARDKAQAQLLTYGPGLLGELLAYADDPDAERKVRIAKLTEELMAIEPDDFELEGQGPGLSLARLDQIVTEHFTIAGKIKQDAFTITSKFGELSVKLKDIKAVERVSGDKPEVRRSIDVSGSDMTCRNYKKTGIRVNRGDRVIISAEGQITMSPWGSNSVSGPDGLPQNGMYNGQIPMGALAGRIGDSGEEFLIGSKSSFVAKKSGVLQLGFAMQQNWANYQFPGKFTARIRVVPAE